MLDRWQVAALVTLPANGTVTIFSPANSVLSLTAPINGPQLPVTVLTPTDDATIAAGANSAVNAGTSATLTVCTATTASHTSTSVALIKFAIPATATMPAGITAVLLEMTLAQAPSNAMLMSVFMTCGSAWSESTITYATAGA